MTSKKAIISDIITFPLDKQPPLLLNFQNGNLQAEASQSLHFTTAIHKETNEKRALLAANGNIYHGCIKERTPTKSVNTLIAVRNKRTNKVRLIQVEPVSMIHSIYEKENKVNESSQSLNYSSVDLLIKNFGDRRANRNFERAQKKKVYIDSLKQQLKQTVDNTEILKKEEEDKETELANEKRTIRPAFNKSAKKLEDIFSLDDLIPKKLMESLNQEAEDVLTTKIMNLPITSIYAKKRIRDIKISNNPRSEKNLSIVKALIYMDALCQVIKLRKNELSKATISKITKKVENDIRKIFDMVEKIEDLNFPAAVVTRLIKDALPPQASVTKEARQAIARAASVFVIYISTSSTTLARKDNHKTITAKYILDALELLEFESFVPPLKEELENYRKTVKEKKDSKVKREGGETTKMEIEEEATTSTEGNAAAASTSNAKPTEGNAAIASTSNNVKKEVDAD